MIKTITLAACIILCGCAANPNFYDVPPEWASSAWVDQDQVWYVPKRNAKVYPSVNGSPIQPRVHGPYLGVPFSEALTVRFEYLGLEGSTSFSSKGYMTHITRNSRPTQKQIAGGR